MRRSGGIGLRQRAAPSCAPHAAVLRAGPNDLGCAAFKGEFKLGNGRYCYPLTVTGHASHFLLLCEALEATREDVPETSVTRFGPVADRERGPQSCIPGMI